MEGWLWPLLLPTDPFLPGGRSSTGSRVTLSPKPTCLTARCPRWSSPTCTHIVTTR